MEKRRMQMREKWDLYDRNRNKLGKTIYRGEELPEGCFHQVIHFVLFNSKGQMLCQRRTITKETYPLFWDVTVGGSALAGETSQQAVHREVLEEIGLDIDFSQMQPTFTNVFLEYIDDYYFVVRDVEPETLVLQKEEVCDVRYFEIGEIGRMIDRMEFVQFSAYEQICEVHDQLFPQ
ncbi:MAG: NUDIX domain-containing protein [Erysipelotrichaceae bacterium]|nr:NUDIX domain-containing protein [Erysipelotrichaceae bacterium]